MCSYHGWLAATIIAGPVWTILVLTAFSNCQPSSVSSSASYDISLVEPVSGLREKVAFGYREIESVAEIQPKVTPHVFAAVSVMNRMYDYSVDIEDLGVPKLRT